MPALVKSVPDQAALALALIENIQREDLNPLEEAQGLARLIDEFGLTHDAAAKAVGRSRSAVSTCCACTQLAKPVQDYLSAARSRWVTRARCSRCRRRSKAAPRRASSPATLGARHRAARRHAARSGASARCAARRQRRDADTVRLENEMAEKLGAKVRIEPGRKGGRAAS